VSERGYRTFYRIVRNNPPTREDMLSYQTLGISPDTNDPETLRLVAGISVNNTLQQARRLVAGPPWRGKGFITELRIPDDAPVTIERTGTRRGHHTLWGNPDGILAYINRVLPIRDKGEEPR